jgi:hypothetical protein
MSFSCAILLELRASIHVDLAEWQGLLSTAIREKCHSQATVTPFPSHV